MRLHCAATLVVRHPAAAADQLDLLRERRIAAVFATGPRDELVLRIAGELGVQVSPLDAEDAQGSAFAHLNEAELQGIADLYRGETVLVLVDQQFAAPPLEIEFGDDGIQVR